MHPTIKDYVIGVALILVGFLALFMWALSKEVNDDSWTAEPNYENSLYIENSYANRLSKIG